VDRSSVPPDSGEGAAGGEGLDLARGRFCARSFQAGQLELLRRGFSAALAEQLSLEALQRMREEVALRLGDEVELLREQVVPGPEFRIYTRTARFQKAGGAIDFVVLLTEQREIAGLEFRAAELGVD
jgi:hypothetical protein